MRLVYIRHYKSFFIQLFRKRQFEDVYSVIRSKYLQDCTRNFTLSHITHRCIFKFFHANVTSFSTLMGAISHNDFL